MPRFDAQELEQIDAMIVRYLRLHQSASAETISAHCGYHSKTVTRRLYELRRARRVHCHGRAPVDWHQSRALLWGVRPIEGPL